MPPAPRLSDAKAFEIIGECLRKRPTSRQADIVERLTKAGASSRTAYRQVKRFFEQGRGNKFLPHLEQARVQVIAALEAEVDEGASSGMVNPATARLYAEATGVLEPPSEAIDEPARLKAAAEAVALLRGIERKDNDHATTQEE